MTLFAGIFSRHENQTVPDSICDGLARVISRDHTDDPQTFQDDRCFFVKVDIGAFGESAFRIGQDGSASVLAGEPLLELSGGVANRSRTKDLDLLHESWERGGWDVVKRARGVFAAAHYNPRVRKLYLISDKLGIRPLYYRVDEHFVIFATALRILESLDAIPKTLDLRGVTEMCGLGYPLGNRTPYAEISLLRSGEIVQIDEKEVARDQYWRWDEIESSHRSEGEMVTEPYSKFMQAVSRRNGKDKSTLAYLSGGLDSRCVVAALQEVGASVHTFNFALPATQDYVFGNEFAANAETIHEAVPKEHGDLTPDYSSMMSRAWNGSKYRNEKPAERPGLAWSGEGGSVALGHVHLSPEIVELMRAGKPDEAIEAYLQQEQASVTQRLLQPDIRGRLALSLHAGIREELKNLRCTDPGRNFYLFLMLNDQRRKLSVHFENIDLYRLEFQLPFFDSEFLALVVSLPIESCLRHRFYVKWLRLFSPAVTEVPWQAYPGHEPCPLPVQQHVAYQWDDAYQTGQAAALKQNLLEQASIMLQSRDFPTEIMKRQYLRIVGLIYKFGIRDYSYVIQAAWKYYSYWMLSDKNYALPSQIESVGLSNGDARSQKFNSETPLRSSAVK